MVSTMTANSFDAKNHDRIAALGRGVMDGVPITKPDALWLLGLEDRTDIFDLMAWANRIREHFKGNKVHLCSIVNVKAGGCSEDCGFCAQSASYQTDAPRYSLVDDEAVLKAAQEASANNVVGLGLVAAWRGLEEGPILDQVCQHFEKMKDAGLVRPDASLGIIKNQRVADRLKHAGVECYNHNLETSRAFYPQVCSTHTYDERVQTIKHLKQAGMRICSGGILGMGESREDRCELAFGLREVGADIVPINVLNPIPGTPMGEREPLPPLEVLKTIACFRFILPKQEIMLAGGRAVNLRDLQSMALMAGASALMIGNYLTTTNQPVERDLQMLKDLGLSTDWKPDSIAGELASCG